MEPKSTPPKFEDAYRQYEFAPLVALALILADWVKVHGVDSLANQRTVGIEGSSGEADSSR